MKHLSHCRTKRKTKIWLIRNKKKSKIENRKIENRFCLCNKNQFFKNRYYLIEKIRSIEWKSNEEIKKKIIKILESNSRLRIAVKNAKKKTKKWLEKDKKIENFDDESTQTSKEIILNVSFAETFVEEKILYKLINCWTLNSEIDVHVCNDSDRFQLNRMIDFENQLIIDKIVYDIENYETINIVVKKFDDSINIQLLNVALMFEFFINLIRLIKMIKKKVHWNIEDKKLHRKKIIFCFVESVEDHWVLENNSSNQTFKTFKVKLKTFKFDLMMTNKKWHEMLEHSKSKIIAHLAEKIKEIKIDDLESTSSINKCETCVFIKTHEIVFRRIDQKKSIDHSLSRID
jgi:hypothetical protein